MSIVYCAKEKIFKLDTEKSSYVFCVSDNDYLEHLYYGGRIEDFGIKSVSNRQIYTFAEKELTSTYEFSLSTVLSEYSPLSCGDIRTPSLEIDFNGEEPSDRFRYNRHSIYKGYKPIDGLPHSRGADACDSLEVHLLNDSKTLEIVLFYKVYPKENVICRYAEIKNLRFPTVYLNKAASACVDFYGSDFDLLTLEGMYNCERSKVQRTPLRKGIQGNFSIVGASSHHSNPFFALCSKNADEHVGDVFGFNLVYSGNFKNEIEVDRLCDTRIVCGINETNFRWKLCCGENFVTPEFVMTYSTEGIGGMSRNMHDHVRNNIVEEQFAFSSRPIVINSWEAAYFGVSEDKIMALAERAEACDADTVVLDDGWFRENDDAGLGDFYTDLSKFPSGLKGLSDKIHQKGLKFGIWLEPEMVAIKSNLYKAEPACVLSAEKQPLIYRNQYVLDLTCEKNVETVKNRILNEFSDVQIDYIKWDCNRYIHESHSRNTLQGEVFHRQILGTYKLLRLIKEAFPHALLETCSGGGGRFDLGMLFFSPQIWTSDNTDPFARIYIEYGTSVAYPQSTISCHFSKGVCTSGRVSSYDFRYLVASFGTFGYELDLTEFSKDDLKKFNAFSKDYKKNEDFVLKGDLYRLISPESNEFCAYIIVNKNKTRALFTFLEINTTGHTESMIVKLRGLAPDKKYIGRASGVVLTGAALMNVGIRIGDLFKEKGGSGRQILFEEL